MPLNQLVIPATPQPCPEQMPVSYFGANYQDSVCIDGYLWDEDSCDGEGLTSGGDIACPFCKPDAHVEYLKDDFERIGCAVCTGDLTDYRFCETERGSVKLYGHCAKCESNQWAKGYEYEVDPDQ